jgi:hypothetical protein
MNKERKWSVEGSLLFSSGGYESSRVTTQVPYSPPAAASFF